MKYQYSLLASWNALVLTQSTILCKHLLMLFKIKNVETEYAYSQMQIFEVDSIFIFFFFRFKRTTMTSSGCKILQHFFLLYLTQYL